MTFPTTTETVAYFSDLFAGHKLHQFLKEYCLANNIEVGHLKGSSRKQEYVRARHEFACLAEDKGYNPEDIADALNRDRTTILHYLDDSYTPPT